MNEERMKEIREPAPCLRCGFSHRFQYPDYSDASKHEADVTACINTLLGELDALKRERDELKVVAAALDTQIPMPTVVLTREQVSRFRDEHMALIRTSDTQSKTEAAPTHKYVSTYCQHDDHGGCRHECKVCEAPCLCRCHLETPETTKATLNQ